MNWNTFFEIGENVTGEEARQFMASSESERYQLVDVRQPKEYERSHIPGALLIPLADLPLKQAVIDPEKPVIVYCRSGVRSKAACQILTMGGAKYVFNMRGGILQWLGEEVVGDEEAGLEYFANGDFQTTFGLAYQMENGLKQFYLLLAGHAANMEEKEMLNHMARLEDGHMAKLLGQYKKHGNEAPEENEFNILEGALDISEIMAVFKDQLGTPEKILQLGMKLEAQSFDLYTRLVQKHQGTEVAEFYQGMANEEQVHLARLSRQLDTLLAQETRLE